MSKLLCCASMLFFLVCMPILTRAQCTVNAGSDFKRCIYSMDSLPLHGTVAGNFTTYNWTTNGTGVLSGSTTLNPEYFHTQADIAAGSVTLTLTASGGTCGAVTDQITITLYKLPSVVLQNDFTVCGTDIPLTSTVVGSSTLQWSTIVGSGTFSTTTTANTTYSTSAADRTRGYILVTLTGSAPASQCIGSDTTRVNIAAAALLNAGPDQTICESANATVVTSATGSGYTSYLWTTSGTGTFVNSTALTSAYVLSAADVVSGSVTLTLTGTSSTCGNKSDSKIITILPALTVSAGIDQTICASTNTVALNGTATSGATLEWSNVVASGTFSNTTLLTPIYAIAAADKARGYALVRLRATKTQGCMKEDTVALYILSAPFVSAGSNKISCSGSVALNGATFNASSRTWTTSGSGTFANANKDTTTYSPSVADRTSGQVTLTYTGGNSCETVSSTTQISFISSSQPQVNAGIDESVCSNDTIQLLGSVVNAAGGNWSSSGSGKFFASKSHLINQYEFSSADKAAGSVVFTLTSYNSGGCGSVSDQKTVTISAGVLPVVNAGPDQVSSVSTPLNATVSNATSQLWQTSGTGLFVPNPTSVNSSYLPSADDIAAGSVVLTLVASGTCSNGSDALNLYTATPSSIKGTVKAGSNTLDKGVVYLFETEGTAPRRLVGMDTLVPSDNGVYEFTSVPQGFYSVYAVPSGYSAYANTYLSTYFGSTAATEWSNAGQEEVLSNSAAHVLNIDLVAYTSALPVWNTGHDTISGAIFLNIPIAVMRLAGTNDTPLPGVVVYLKTLSGQVIAYTATDKDGAYAFNNVLQGNYFVDAEYAGTETRLADKIVAVDGNPQTVEDGSVIINNKVTLTTSVLPKNKAVQLNAYPNPASDLVRIQVPETGNYSVKVLDETGTLHTEQQLSVTSGAAVEVSLLNLNKGLYIIQIASDDEVYTTKIVKF